jgi:hypothetical protein
MKDTRRTFLKSLAISSVVPTVLSSKARATAPNPTANSRQFRFIQMDVFTSRRLEGNPLSVFTDARGLSDSEMQDWARETNLQETTFVLPRDPSVEAQEGVKVRIFTPDEELSFGGHPTLGTANVLRNLRLATSRAKTLDASDSTIVLDLKVGKVPVSFHEDTDGTFGEMRQVPPSFGKVHDRSIVAEALGLQVDEVESDLPIQTVSTGFALYYRSHQTPQCSSLFTRLLEGLRLPKAAGGSAGLLLHYPRHWRPESGYSSKMHLSRRRRPSHWDQEQGALRLGW